MKRERGNALIILLLALVLVLGTVFATSYVFYNRTPVEVAEEAKEQVVDSGGEFWDGVRDWIGEFRSDENPSLR